MSQFRIASLLLIVCVSQVHAQNPPQAIPVQSAPSQVPPNCTTLFGGYQSCRSYMELVDNQDPEVLGMISGDKRAFVCFREDEDTFVLVSWLMPMKSGFWPSKILDGAAPPDEVRSAGAAAYVDYRGGVEQVLNCHLWRGFWTAQSKALVDQASFSAATKDRAEWANVDSSQAKLVFTYKNSLRALTMYSITINLSTGRFLEEFSSGEITAEQRGHCLANKTSQAN
jgi:hypothetical protein